MTNLNILSTVPTIFIYTVVPAIFFWIISKTKISKISLLIYILFSIFYFGPLEFLKTIIFFISAYIIGKKLFKNNQIIGLIISILIIIQTHVILSLIIGTQNSQKILFLIEILIIVIQKKLINKELYKNIQLKINSLNLVEIFVLFFASIISSQPQVAWDAVYANLYNAKWYFLNNSLSYLTESISSLFPQNGIMYFSYFYGLGGNKILQLAYLLPLILIIFILKQIRAKIKNITLFNLASLLLIATPIFIFESSTGYYDSLVLLCCIAVISIFLFDTNYTKKHFYLSSFIIGFGGGIKYFPLAFSIIPIFFILKSKFDIFSKLKILLFSIILLSFPLLIWSFRTYKITGNPVFPFAQYIFPTPDYWEPTDILEKNYMIQTPMLAKEWLLGGFIYYPIKTYQNTEKYLEAPKGYTTRSPIIFNLISIILIINFLIKIIKKEKINNIEILLILSYISFLFVGLLTRYYRYLWPFQTTVSCLTLLLIFKKYKDNILVLLIISICLLSNFKNLFDHLKYYQIFNDKLFNPNYFQNKYENNNPIFFINQNTNINDLILDSSKNLLPRIYLNSKVTECNWYWINGTKIINQKDILKKFKYIVLSSDTTFNDYCTNTININIPNMKTVFENQDYKIFQPNL